MLTVSRRNSFLGRIYAYWERHGGKNKSDYNENLCHFVRVLFIWTPLFFFFKQPLGHRYIRLWMVGLVGLLAASYLAWPRAILAVLSIIGLMVIVVVVIAIMICAVVFLDKIGDDIKYRASHFTTVQVITAWIMAQKHKVCPYIKVTD